ncbi:M48 family metalloprotease [Terriglobus tenax]|uniref:M48 family metalloprotease n=1 Tax=Terriglobus tenax TaxID=1111115 RepID=UPI0021DFB143|nr:M48 family metalloprotease [Terriglobus tenax]
MPAAQRDFLETLCRERGLKLPRLGVIYSGTPNAFAFGHHRGRASIVVTEGLLQMLTTEEANAVLAHEMGHVEHNDFIVMTLAAVAPMILYQIYAWTDRIENTRVIAWCAYAAYWVGQFLVLQINRLREYYADHYSACVTKAPAQLASALVKIAYGMVKADGEYRQSRQKGYSGDKSYAKAQHHLGRRMGLMGISSAQPGGAFGLMQAADPQLASAIMEWDLSSPWARVYQINSTHPLTAMRIRALNQYSEQNHLGSEYPMPLGKAVRWSGFPVEFFFWATPVVCGALAIWGSLRTTIFSLFHIHQPRALGALLLIACGTTWMGRIAFRYRGSFADRKIGDLLGDLGVNEMRPRAVRIQGEIIGRGIPGSFWSPDLVVRDETGFLFMLNRQSIPFARFLFGIKDADLLIGEQVTLEGWYRRGLAPYIEMSSLRAEITPAANESGSVFGKESIAASAKRVSYLRRSYSRWIQLLLAAAATGAGIVGYLGLAA